MAKKISKDWGLKALSLIFAIMLWIYAGAEQNPPMEKSFDVGITYQNLQADYVVLEAPNTIRVTVRGRQNELLSLRADDFTALVDLGGVTVGSNDCNIVLTIPPTVDRYTNGSTKIKVVIEQSATKTVQIAPKLTGQVPEGYRLVKTTVEPEVVTISGFSGILAGITTLSTEEIDTSNLTANATIQASVQIPEGIYANSGMVSVTMEIQSLEKTQELTIPITVRNVPEGMSASISAESAVISIKGTLAEMSKTGIQEQLQLFIDCVGLEEGEHEIQLQLENQSTLTVTQVSPAAVTVILTTIAGEEQPEPPVEQP